MNESNYVTNKFAKLKGVCWKLQGVLSGTLEHGGVH